MNTSITLCTCSNCPGANCACGCREAAALSATPAACDCGPRCGCEAAAGGCLCR